MYEWILFDRWGQYKLHKKIYPFNSLQICNNMKVQIMTEISLFWMNYSFNTARVQLYFLIWSMRFDFFSATSSSSPTFRLTTPDAAETSKHLLSDLVFCFSWVAFTSLAASAHTLRPRRWVFPRFLPLLFHPLFFSWTSIFVGHTDICRFSQRAQEFCHTHCCRETSHSLPPFHQGCRQRERGRDWRWNERKKRDNCRKVGLLGHQYPFRPKLPDKWNQMERQRATQGLSEARERLWWSSVQLVYWLVLLLSYCWVSILAHLLRRHHVCKIF